MENGLDVANKIRGGLPMDEQKNPLPHFKTNHNITHCNKNNEVDT